MDTRREPDLLCSQRRVGVERIGAYLSTIALLHPHYRVHFVENAHVISEDALSLRAFHRVGATGRPTCTILLEGAARISAFGSHYFLEPGSVLLVSKKQSICMRQEGPRYRAIALEWTLGQFGPTPSKDTEEFRLQTHDLNKLEELWGSPFSGEYLLRKIEQMLKILNESGLPFENTAPSELSHQVAPRMRELNQALDEVLSQNGSRPTTVDLEERMGLSSRQLNRLVEQYNRTYGFNSEGWRDTVKRRRIMLGACLMTAPGVKVIEVAKTVGFSTAEAFAQALAEAGLPAPSKILGEVKQLGVLASKAHQSSTPGIAH